MSQSESNQNRTAIVTGGSGGIGAGLCRRLAADSFNVVVHYHSQADAAQAIVDEIQASSGSAVALGADVGSEEETEELFSKVIESFGSIDVVVVNAGVGGSEQIADFSLADFDKLVGVNFRGAFLTIRQAARDVADHGRIIFVSSLLAVRPMARSGVYAATKAGMDALVVSLAHELGNRKITVNSVRPGATVPGMFAKSDEERKEKFRQMSPLNRLGTPEDIAGVVSFLASPDSAWITGKHLEADGGAAN